MWHPAFGRPTVDLGADAPQRHRGYGSPAGGEGEGGDVGQPPHPSPLPPGERGTKAVRGFFPPPFAGEGQGGGASRHGEHPPHACPLPPGGEGEHVASGLRPAHGGPRRRRASAPPWLRLHPHRPSLPRWRRRKTAHPNELGADTVPPSPQPSPAGGEGDEADTGNIPLTRALSRGGERGSMPTVDLGADAPQRHRGYGSPARGEGDGRRGDPPQGDAISGALPISAGEST